MKTYIQKWGNSYGLRIPKPILEELNISINDKLDLAVEGNKIVIKKNQYDEFSIKENAEAHYGKPFKKLVNILNNKEIDWGNPTGEEEW